MHNPLLIFIIILMMFVQTAVQGTSISIYLANSSKIEGLIGGYYKDGQKANPSTRATNTRLSFKSWVISKELTNKTHILESLQLII